MTLISRLKENRDSDIYPFHMPGHKRNLVTDVSFKDIYGLDITEIPGFDDLHDACGIIKEAEERCAGLFGSDETHFLVNGSTGGILAAITGSVTDTDSVIFASNCHRSVYNAVMLSGARPYVITPGSEAYFDINAGISAEAVTEAFDHAGGKRVAVVITSPTYEGITSDVEGIARICHERGAVLIVDAAHGAHLGLSEGFPQSAVAAGADIVIASVHKTLPAMTQTALIHINRNCPSKERVRKMLSVFMTSSPSYVLMASIDSMTGMLVDQGPELFEKYQKRLDRFYEKAAGFECLSVLCKEKLTAKGSADHDRSKIVVSDMTSSFTGKQLFDLLLDKYGICAEMSTDTYVLLMTGIADTDEGFRRLTDALFEIDSLLEGRKEHTGTRGFFRRLVDRAVGYGIARPLKTAPDSRLIPDSLPKVSTFANEIKQSMFEENTESIPVELAEGRRAADYVFLYPPGIPLTVPGKVIDGDTVDRILEATKSGLDVKGLIDKEIAVIWERSSIL